MAFYRCGSNSGTFLPAMPTSASDCDTVTRFVEGGKCWGMNANISTIHYNSNVVGSQNWNWVALYENGSIAQGTFANSVANTWKTQTITVSNPVAIVLWVTGSISASFVGSVYFS